MYGKVFGYVVVREFVFWIRGVLGKVMIKGWVLICENRRIRRYVPVDVAGCVSERCCLALYGMKVAVSLASVKCYVGMVYSKLD
jgi:hypothetical protein